MYSPKEDFQILVDLGLTLLQAKVFLALLSRGTSKVTEISQVSKVSRPDVYRSLSKLQELGLIEKEISKPYLFRTIPAENAISILITSRDTKTKDLKNKTKFLLNKYTTIKQIISYQEESKFIFVPSQESLISKLTNAIQSANKSIDVLTSSKRFIQACTCLTKPLEEAWKRQVKGRAIIERPKKSQIETFLKIWKYPWADILYITDSPNTIMAIYDKKKVFIFTKPDANLKDSPALWSNNSSLVNIANKYFEGIWNKPNSRNLSIPEEVIC